MSYLYKLENNKSLLLNADIFGINYLPVKRKASHMQLRDVALYIKNDDSEGIFGFAKILEDKTLKSSEIKVKKKINFINRNFFQLPVKFTICSSEPLIEIRHLRHFPSYNSSLFQKPFNPFVLYWSGALHWEYSYLQHRFSYDFCPETGPNFFPDRYWKHYIHFLREQHINYFWNKKLPKEKQKCEICGEKLHSAYFLEIHDTTEIDFNGDFKPIKIEDFIVLCPSCHKKEHLKLKQ